MPLIFCPTCNKITYAYPLYSSSDCEITAYRCSQCYNVFNVDHVNVIPFPNETITLNTTFADIIADVNKMTTDEVYEKCDDPAEEFYYILLYLCRPDEPRIVKHKIAHWNYRGTREAEEYNEELFEEIQRFFADVLDKNYVVLEIREMDEGDSLFIAIHPDDVDIVEKALRDYILLKD